jgi:hypothetical protein
MLAATIGVAYNAGVYDGAASHSCIEPTSKPFGHGEMLTEFGPHVVSGEIANLAGTGVNGGVNLALLRGCPFGVGNRLADLHCLSEWCGWFSGWYSTVTNEMCAALNVGPCDDAFADGAIHRAFSNAAIALSIVSMSYSGSGSHKLIALRMVRKRRMMSLCGLKIVSTISFNAFRCFADADVGSKLSANICRVSLLSVSSGSM